MTIDEVQGTVLAAAGRRHHRVGGRGHDGAGATRSFALRTWRVGTGAESAQARLALAASTELRAQLYAFVGRSCGWGAPAEEP